MAVTQLLMPGPFWPITTDRKSIRLNSSHQIISYAVFCLKKKKTHLILNNDLLAETAVLGPMTQVPRRQVEDHPPLVMKPKPFRTRYDALAQPLRWSLLLV